MAGLFGGGKKKSSAPREQTPVPAPTAPSTDPDVLAADQRRRLAGMRTDTLMTEGVPSLEKTAADYSRRQTLGG